MIEWLVYLSLLPTSLKAEYRVFALQITDPQGKVIREFPSTLDPLQYVYYYPLPKEQLVQYTTTWLCPGNTSHFKPLCPRPSGEETKEVSAP